MIAEMLNIQHSIIILFSNKKEKYCTVIMHKLVKKFSLFGAIGVVPFGSSEG